MPVAHHFFLTTLWMLWAAYWWMQSRQVKSTVRRESWRSRWMHFAPLLIAALLLWAPKLPLPLLEDRWLPVTLWQLLAGEAMTMAGLGFTVWARRHLGRNWSVVVTIKQGHELVTSGPYAWVRHPIYTGLLLAFAGSALAQGEWRGVLALALAIWALGCKLRLEERWLREQFGPAYQAYCGRVAALLPFVY